MPTIVDVVNTRAINTTVKIFNTVYSLVKRNRPLSDIDALELQEKNGVDIGNCFHSRYTATNIAKHIATEIKRMVFKNIIKLNSKICIIIDEASTFAKKNTLVIFLQCEIESAVEPVLLFVDLKELTSTTAKNILKILLYCLAEYGFNNNYLRKNLIAFCSDGASTMLGRKSGVAAKLVELFPNLVVWHCLNQSFTTSTR